MSSSEDTPGLGLLGHQSLARPLTPAEQQLAQALEQVYASGRHEFALVVQALEQMQVARPSGAGGPWTLEVLEAELQQINSSLDAAYAGRSARPLRA